MILAKDSFVIFLHIQKTSGITIQRIFRRKLGKSILKILFNIIKNQDNFSNIENYFLFIGITEYFDQSILLLQHIMSWKNCYYLRRNVTKAIDKEIISQELKEKIKEKNYFDIKLYEYAKELFLKNLKQYNLDDQNKLQKFQKHNFIFNQVFSLPYSIYDQAKATIRGTAGRPG